jgi:hypothetical protein
MEKLKVVLNLLDIFQHILRWRLETLIKGYVS